MIMNGDRVCVRCHSRIVSELWELTGTITDRRVNPDQSIVYWLQFDEPTKVIATMTGVWLSADMFRKVYYERQDHESVQTGTR